MSHFSGSEGQSLRALIRQAREMLQDVSGGNAALDVKILTEWSLGISPIEQALEGDQIIPAADAEKFILLVSRRQTAEPISQIIGEKEFWSLTFKVTKDTLTPRPDSETLIEWALDTVKDRKKPLKILDLGTGTGCLLLSLLSELPEASGIGLDFSVPALEVAKFNAHNLKLAGRCEFIQSDWFANILAGEKFDIIMCNPPYISWDERPDLSSDVADFEPDSALFSDEGGVKDYEVISKDILEYLTADGFAMFEIGYCQANEVTDIMSRVGGTNITIRKDLAGNDRALRVFL